MISLSSNDTVLPHILSFSLLSRSLHSTLSPSLKDSVSSSVHSLANELSYWNRRESAPCCRKCCHGKPHRRKREGKLLAWTKKHENVLSLKMYQFRLMLDRLQPFSFPSPSPSALIIIYRLPHSPHLCWKKSRKVHLFNWFFCPLHARKILTGFVVGWLLGWANSG